MGLVSDVVNLRQKQWNSEVSDNSLQNIQYPRWSRKKANFPTTWRKSARKWRRALKKVMHAPSTLAALSTLDRRGKAASWNGQAMRSTWRYPKLGVQGFVPRLPRVVPNDWHRTSACSRWRGSCSWAELEYGRNREVLFCSFVFLSSSDQRLSSIFNHLSVHQR